MLLLSVDSLLSEQCQALLVEARERKVRIVPVLLRPVDRTTIDTLFPDADFLPQNKTPITLWPTNLDDALANVAAGLRLLILSAEDGQTPAKAVITAKTTGRDALRIGMRLDRTDQWKKVKEQWGEWGMGT